MIRTLRHLFLGRLLREKLLLVAFVGIGALWWLSAFADRAGAFKREAHLTTLRLAEQSQWIRNRTVIEETAQRTAGRLDPARALNGNQLVTIVAQLATEAGLKNAVSGTPATERSGQFAIHSSDFAINQADWEPLRKFYEALQARSPYISVERFALSATPNAAARLSLNLKVVSVELVNP
jgi:hypothetical protein